MRIAIIGAGLAGLTAAYELRDHDVEVFEAAGRIGGKLYSVPFNDGPTDMGAEAFLSRRYVSSLRAVAARRGPGSRAAHLADLLHPENEEFRALWDSHEVGVRTDDVKRLLHPEVGPLELHCQTLLDPDQSHLLLVYTAVPGSETHEKLQLLSVIGADTVDDPSDALRPR